MTKLFLMDDRNEGIGSVLESQDSLTFGHGVRDKQGFTDSHERSRFTTFISCWTESPEEMSMWLLYSKDFSAIRVATTKEKLESATLSFWKENFWRNHLDSPEGTLQTDCPPVVDSVKYESFERVSQLIREKWERRRVELSRPGSIDTESKLLSASLSDIYHESVVTPGDGILLKDRSYSHEKEYRATLKCCLRNGLAAEEWRKKEKSSDEMRYVFGTATCAYPESDVMPDILQLSVADDFIDEICFDPRMESYRKDVFSEVLGINSRKIQIAESSVFGYMPDVYDFSV